MTRTLTAELLLISKRLERRIANTRVRERRERNNPWSEPAVLKPRMTDAEILEGKDDAPSE